MEVIFLTFKKLISAWVVVLFLLGIMGYASYLSPIKLDSNVSISAGSVSLNTSNVHEPNLIVSDKVKSLSGVKLEMKDLNLLYEPILENALNYLSQYHTVDLSQKRVTSKMSEYSFNNSETRVKYNFNDSSYLLNILYDDSISKYTIGYWDNGLGDGLYKDKDSNDWVDDTYEVKLDTSLFGSSVSHNVDEFFRNLIETDFKIPANISGVESGNLIYFEHSEQAQDYEIRGLITDDISLSNVVLGTKDTMVFFSRENNNYIPVTMQLSINWSIDGVDYISSNIISFTSFSNDTIPSPKTSLSTVYDYDSLSDNNLEAGEE